jgi:hypothetical protein
MRKGHPRRRAPLVAGVLVLGALAAPSTASAAIYLVGTKDDLTTSMGGVCIAGSFDLPSSCSLRAAIEQTNRSGVPSQIWIPADTYVLTQGALQIAVPTKLFGANMDTTTLDGNGKASVLEIGATGVVEIRNLTITHGGEPFDMGRGGGINNWNKGTVAMRNVRVANNHVTGWGGGILNTGYIVMQDSEIMGNSSGADGHGQGGFQGWGGGIFNMGTLKLHRTTVAYNDAMRGGGIHNRGTADISQSTISSNTARNSGGGIHSTAGAVRIRFSTITNNTSRSTPPPTNCGLTPPTNRDGSSRCPSPPEDQAGSRACNCHADDYPQWGGANGGGIVSIGGAALEIGGTILAGNRSFNGRQDGLTDSADCYVPWMEPNAGMHGPNLLLSARNNLIGAVTSVCAYQDVNGPSSQPYDYYSLNAARPIDPQIGPLTFNGGVTQTHALLDSIALNGATGLFGMFPGQSVPPVSPISPDPWFTCTDEIDQRGFPRGVGPWSVCDVGSYERQ